MASLDDAVQNPPSGNVSIGTEDWTNPPLPSLAAVRASKAAWGLQELVNKKYGDYYGPISQGQEPALRREVAADIDQQKVQNILEQLPTAGLDKVRGMIVDNKPTNAKSVFEDGFSAKFINTLYNEDPQSSSWIHEAMADIPIQFHQTLQLGQTWLSNVEYARKREADNAQVQHDQGWIPWLADLGKTLDPTYTTRKLTGLAGGVGMFDSFLGSNLAKQAAALRSLPPEEFKPAFDAIMDSLERDNPQVAGAFANAVALQSTYQIAAGNVFQMIDIANLVGFGKVGASVAKKAFLWNSTQQAVKDTVLGAAKASGETSIKEAVAGAVGDTKEAAIQQTVANTVKGFSGQSNPIAKSVEALKAGFYTDAAQIREGAKGSIWQDLANKIAETTENMADRVMERIDELQKVERISGPLATEAVTRGIADWTKDNYKGFSNQIMHIGDIKWEQKTNTYFNEVYFGKPGNELWPSYQMAKTFGRDVLRIEGEPVPVGKGFIYKVNQSLPETMDLIRDNLLARNQDKTPDSMLHTFLYWLDYIRTPEETLSLDQRMQRKAASYAPSEALKLAKESLQDIEGISKFTLPGTKKRAVWQDWERIVNSARDNWDLKNQEKGYFYKTTGELEAAYLQNFNRIPEKQEVQAYFAFVRAIELDRTFRNINLYKMMSRVGVKDHSFFVVDQQGQKVNSPVFHAVIRDKIPGGEDTMLIVGDKPGDYQLVRSHRFKGEFRDQVDADVEKGARRVLEMWDPELRELGVINPGDAKLQQAKIRYVVAKNVETKDLPFDLVPRRGGGHFDVDAEFYAKQAKVRPESIDADFRNIYEGDTTLASFMVGKQGTDWVRHVNEVRRLLWDEKNEVAAKAYNDKHLAIDWKEHKGWYEPSKDPKGNPIAPWLSQSEDIRLVPKDKKITDLDNALKDKYGNTFEDGTRSGSLARQYQVKYTGARDSYELYQVKDVGTQGNPIYSMEPAKLVDPIPTMTRALSRIINTTWMDDYKIQAIEKWLQRAKGSLKLDHMDQINYAPFHYFHNPEFNSATSAETKASLMAEWHNINQFTGRMNTLDAYLHNVSQKMVDGIYGKLGPKLVPLWAIGKEKDPIRALRSMVFHSAMGLFNIPQYFVHAFTVANVWGIAGPINGARGTVAALLHTFARLNRTPEFLDKLDSIASAFGWRPGTWKEALYHLDRTGFMNEAGQYALKDDIYSYKLVNSATDQFLDMGQSPFRSGVKTLRAASWYTAFYEFRHGGGGKIFEEGWKGKIGGAISNQERGQILERSDIFSHNMTRASSSMVHSGVFSLPAQFYTYFLRLGELFTGKRLTMMEKAKLFGVNAILYGLPTATGLSMFPFEEQIRKQLHAMGYVIGDNFLLSFINEGALASLGAVITGKGDPQAGAWYNFGPRYGPEGVQSVGQFLDREKDFWELAGGALGSKLGDIIYASSPLRAFIMATISGENVKFKPEDFLEPFRTIASVNSVVRLWQTINTGNFYSTKGRLVAPSDTATALWRSVTGLADQHESDMYTKGLSMKAEKETQETGFRLFEAEWHKFLEDNYNGDKDSAEARYIRAETILKQYGYPDEKLAEAHRRANNSAYQPLLDAMDWAYYNKSVPPWRKQIMDDTDAYRRTIQIQQKREQR